MTTDKSRIGTNSGHGHVWPRPDGMRARCGGVVLCATCRADAALLEQCPICNGAGKVSADGN